MAIKFKPNDSSSVRNIKTLKIGIDNTGRRIAKVLWTDESGILYSAYTLTYPLTANITNGSLSGGSEIKYGESKVFTFVPTSTDYATPVNLTDITITGATASYNRPDLTLTAIAGAELVTVTATCPQAIYNVSINITSGTGSGPSTISPGEMATFTIIPTTGGSLIPPPQEDITVVGATIDSYTREGNIGTLVIKNPTADVSITATCPVGYKVTNTCYNGAVTPNVGYVKNADSISLEIQPNSQYTYPDAVSFDGSAAINYTQETGTIIFTNVLSDVVVTVSCKAGDKLGTPAPVKLSGNILSIDHTSDSRATGCDIYIDDTLVQHVDG